MTIVDDNANEIIRKATVVKNQGYYQHRVALDNVSISPFDELKTVTRNVQIELKSAVETISGIRNLTQSTNGGVTTTSSGEYRVFTNNFASATSSLESAGRGRYIPGYQAECGIGLRLPTQSIAGTKKVEWGYFDTDDGIGYGVDAGGFYIFSERLGVVTTKVYQQNFNLDTVDGSNSSSNPSGASLDLSKGNIFQMHFIWYGYGAVQWSINVQDVNKPNGGEVIALHKASPNGQTSISQPNLPISIRVENGDQATGLEAYVGGRQFSIYGPSDSRTRINGNYVLSKTVPINAWTPLVSFRRKPGRGSYQTVRLSNVELTTTQPLIYSFVSNGTLTGASFGALRDISPNETVTESDIASSAITGGIFFGGYSFATDSKPNAAEVTRLANLSFEFIGVFPVTLVARPLSTQAVVSAFMDIEESW